MVNRNYVAKNARKFNKAAKHIDRKKEAKKTGKYLKGYGYAQKQCHDYMSV